HGGLAWLAVRFFFSSSGRHTRFSRDWSSDVCSSDLDVARVPQRLEQRVAETQRQQVLYAFLAQVVVDPEHAVLVEHTGDAVVDEIGRASCRDRVYRWVGGGASERNKRRGITRLGAAP